MEKEIGVDGGLGGTSPLKYMLELLMSLKDSHLITQAH
jgi:hypothetical protein